MVQATNPQLVQTIENANDAQVFDLSEQVQQVDSQAWAQIVDDSPICDFGFVLGTSAEAQNALSDLVVLEFGDIENEPDVAQDLLDALASEYAELLDTDQTDNNPLPPQFEQLRQELGDEAFAEWLQSNKEQFGSLQGISEGELDGFSQEQIEQFEAIEESLQQWLTGTEEPIIFITSVDWQVNAYDLTIPGSTDKALPWVNLNTFEVQVEPGVVLAGNELELFGTRPTVDGPAPVIPVTFMGQEGNVGVWVFDDLGNGYYQVDVAGTSPVSFSVLAGNGSSSSNSANSIDFADFAGLATTFGAEVPAADVNSADYNGDGIVGFGDFAVLATNFGAKLPPIDFAPGFWSPNNSGEAVNRTVFEADVKVAEVELLHRPSSIDGSFVA